MAKRKTINLKDLVEMGNEMLSCSICSAEEREGMIRVLESALHKANNYQGFRYLSNDEVPFNHRAGINTDENGFFDNFTYEERFSQTDDTRRKYFFS